MIIIADLIRIAHYAEQPLDRRFSLDNNQIISIEILQSRYEHFQQIRTKLFCV
jgi:hypothetical protein